jgi:hypothetical protein
MDDQIKSPDELILDALQKVEDASREPAAQIQEGIRLLTKYLTQQNELVASEQRRIRRKVQDGSRLTKHRFTV